MSTATKIILAIVGAAALLIGGAVVLAAVVIGTAANEVAEETGLDGKTQSKATENVKITQCGGWGAYGEGPKSEVTIVNESKKTLDYVVEVTYKDKGGNTIGTGVAHIENLDPGKTWTGAATGYAGDQAKTEYTCEVGNVAANNVL